MRPTSSSDASGHGISRDARQRRDRLGSEPLLGDDSSPTDSHLPRASHASSGSSGAGSPREVHIGTGRRGGAGMTRGGGSVARGGVAEAMPLTGQRPPDGASSPPPAPGDDPLVVVTPRIGEDGFSDVAGRLAAGTDAVADPARDEGVSWFTVMLTTFSAIGGLLFGYDTGVVSGALLVIKKEFGLGSTVEEVIVSATIGAAIVGAATAGRFADSLGRRPVIIISSVVFIVGAILMAFASTVPILIAGRAVVGVAIGLSSMTIPMYIAECAAPEHRGLLVTINNMFITGGQFGAALVDGAFADVQDGWRYMLGLSAVPAAIQLLGFLFLLPESPRHLVMRGKLEEAARVMSRARKLHVRSAVIRTEIDSIKSDAGLRSPTLREVFASPAVRRALVLGCFLQLMQQLGGINTVMYYSGTIITLAGIHDTTEAIWLVAAVAFVNFAFTGVGVWAVDRVGRRVLTLSSLAGVAVCLALLGVSFYIAADVSPEVVAVAASGHCGAARQCFDCATAAGCGFCHNPAAWLGSNGSAVCLPGNATGALAGAAACPGGTVVDPNWLLAGCPSNAASWVTFAGLLLYLACFAPGMGPMPWTINSEIYPLHARATCVGVATATNWLSNFVVAMTFLTLTEVLTSHGAFWFYAAIAFVGWIVLYRILPETKGRSLEDVVGLFKRESDGEDALLSTTSGFSTSAYVPAGGH